MSTAFFGSCAPATPSGPPLDGMYDWFKADAGITEVAGKVTAWANSCPTPAHPVLTKIDNEPDFVASWINGQPAVMFSGALGAMNLGSAAPGSVAQPLTYYFVLDSSTLGYILYAPGGSKLVVGYDGGKIYVTSDNFMSAISGNFSLASPVVVAVVINSILGPSDIWVNNSSVATGDVGVGPQDGLILGSDNAGGNYISMQLGEFIAYNVAHDTTTRHAVQNYLSAKYNITLAP